MVFVLGLNGPAGAGKDTVADFLIKNKGWNGKLSFARNLKDICKKVFNLTEFQVSHQDGKKTEFDAPIVFNGAHLGAIFVLMTKTHAKAPLQKGSKDKVLSLVGTELVNPRHVLQFVGTDICRELIPSYHLDVLASRIEKLEEGNYIITDVRFPNEGDMLLDYFKGLVVYIDRPSPSVQNINKKHPSEVAMIEWGRFSSTINNHREGLDFLYKEVDAFLEELGL